MQLEGSFAEDIYFFVILIIVEVLLSCKLPLPRPPSLLLKKNKHFIEVVYRFFFISHHPALLLVLTGLAPAMSPSLLGSLAESCRVDSVLDAFATKS